MLHSTIFKADIANSQFTAEPTTPHKPKAIKYDAPDDRFSKSLAAKQQQEAHKQDMLQQRSDKKSRQQDALQEQSRERHTAEARRNERADTRGQQVEEKTDASSNDVKSNIVSDTPNATEDVANEALPAPAIEVAPVEEGIATSVLTDILTGFDAKAADDALADTANQEILTAALSAVAGGNDAAAAETLSILAVDGKPFASPADHLLNDSASTVIGQELPQPLLASTALTNSTMTGTPPGTTDAEEVSGNATSAELVKPAASIADEATARSVEDVTLNPVEQAVVAEVTTAIEQTVEQAVIAAQKIATPTMGKNDTKPAVKSTDSPVTTPASNVANVVPVNLADAAVNPASQPTPIAVARISTSLEESLAAHAAVDRYDGDTAARDSDNTASMINHASVLSEPPVGIQQVLSNVLSQAALATQPNSITLPDATKNFAAGASPLSGTELQPAPDPLSFEPVTLDDGSTDWLDMLQKFDQHQANKTNPASQTQQSFKQGPSPAAEQIALQVRKALETGQEQFRLQLKPARLGSIDVQMTIAQDGGVQAVLSVENPETHDWLQKDRQQLERILQESGLNTNEDSVQLQYRDPQHSNKHSNQGQQEAGEYSRREVVEVETQTVSAPLLTTAPNNNRLDVHI